MSLSVIAPTEPWSTLSLTSSVDIAANASVSASTLALYVGFEDNAEFFLLAGFDLTLSSSSDTLLGLDEFGFTLLALTIFRHLTGFGSHRPPHQRITGLAGTPLRPSISTGMLAALRHLWPRSLIMARTLP